MRAFATTLATTGGALGGWQLGQWLAGRETDQAMITGAIVLAALGMALHIVRAIAAD